MEGAFVAALALGTRLIYLDHVPHKDELNHVLAARSLLSAGNLEIMQGADPYDRARVFTYMVAGMFRLFGESLVVARIPAVIAGVALVLALFLWVRAEAGRAGAWVGALLLIFSPIALQLSQWSRFYTLHGLLVFLACLLVYRLFTTPAQRGWAIAARGSALVLCLLLAFHLQETTAVVAGGLVLWMSLTSMPRLWRRFPEPRQRKYLVGGLLGLLALLGLAAVLTGMAEWAIARAGHVDVWAERDRTNVRFYHFLLLNQYPALWTLFPLAVLLAAAVRPRAALLCTCVFGVALVAHSIMAWKTERYLSYAMPMFFALWGIAVGVTLPWIKGQLYRLLSDTGGAALPRRVRRPAVTALLIFVALFAAAGSGATSYAFKMLTVPDAEWGGFEYRGDPNWVAAAHMLGPLVHEADVVVASYDITSLYALGRVDYLMHRVRTGAGPIPEFGSRGKTLARVITTPESLSIVMSCHAQGLVMIERFHRNKEWAVSSATVDYLEAHTQAIPLPRHLRLHAYGWDGRGENAGSETLCPSLP